MAEAEFDSYLCMRVKYARNPTKLRIFKPNNTKEEEVYRHIATLGFDGKRRRVTVVYEKDGMYHCMCKGADTNMVPLFKVSEHHETRRASE